MVGILKGSLIGAETVDFEGAIELAAATGFDAFMVNNVYEISHDLDEGAIRAGRQLALEKGVRLAAGLGGFNPLRHERCALVAQAGNGDPVQGALKLAGVAARCGLGELFFSVGMIPDREDPELTWAAQLEAVRAGLVAIAPALRDLGTRLLIKSHEEITTHEILWLIEAVGADVLGVAHDPVNVVCRIEEPVAATRRLAPYIRQIHIDDASLHLDGQEVRRYLAPIGQGDLDWPAMLALVPEASRWVEIHRGQFAMACFDRDWMAQQPGVSVDEYCFVAGTAVRRGAEPALCDQLAPYARVPALRDWVSAQA
ncbi:MAG: TIM barrel protein [Candidatus Kaistia colombiensis]|nr:MAG: TIM barrel protein [Kaistia sp.]